MWMWFVALLSNETLRERLTDPVLERRLVVTPLLDVTQIGPTSVDVRLGTEFLMARKSLEAGFDLGHQTEDSPEHLHERVVIPIGSGLWLHPGQLILGATLEFLKFPADLGAYVIGRSSWGRMGLMPATAIMVHPGFTGNLTLELVNSGDTPMRLYPGLPIAQLAMHTVDRPTGEGYTSIDKYFGPIGPQVSRLGRERGLVARLERLQQMLPLGASTGGEEVT